MATLKELHPDVNLDEVQPEDATATKLANKAATELITFLKDDGPKDRRIVFRVNNKTAAQLNAISKKKGITVSSVLQQLVSDYIRQNENLI